MPVASVPATHRPIGGRPAGTPLQRWAGRLLLEGDLAVKLSTPPPSTTWYEGDLAAAVDVEGPVRSEQLALVEEAGEKGERLPRLNQLVDAEARVACLHRFAHHELMALELFAWALLRFPDAAVTLQRGWVAALVEEQRHLQLYLDRLAAHGATFGDLSLSGYFWRLMPGVRSAPDPLKAFLCMQGLTLEAANLDFTLMYRDAFATAGDTESAAVLHTVHNDEIGHVRLARAHLLRSVDNVDDVDDVDDVTVEDLGAKGNVPLETSTSNLDRRLYQAHVPFPLSAARAKGRRFEKGARKRAGFSADFIAFVEAARPYERSPSSPSPASSASSASPSTASSS